MLAFINNKSCSLFLFLSIFIKESPKSTFTTNMDIIEIVRRVKTGDTTALAILIEAYTPMVRKVCSNITDEDEDTLNDVVQVCLSVLIILFINSETLQNLENGCVLLQEMRL